MITGRWSSTGGLACSALELQLRLHRERQADSKTANASLDTTKLDEDTTSVIQSTLSSLDVDVTRPGGLPFETLVQVFGASLERLPYFVFCALRKNSANEGVLGSYDIDEWYVSSKSEKGHIRVRLIYLVRLLQNERWLRDHPTQDWRRVAYS